MSVMEGVAEEVWNIYSAVHENAYAQVTRSL
jgi:hypothetical protein